MVIVLNPDVDGMGIKFRGGWARAKLEMSSRVVTPGA
jgi:hypothetical protein